LQEKYGLGCDDADLEEEEKEVPEEEEQDGAVDVLEGQRGFERR